MRMLAHPIIVAWSILAVCLVDFFTQIGIAAWAFYVLPIWLASRIAHRGPARVYQTGVACVVLSAGGLFFSPVDAVPLWVGITNRGIAIGILALLSMLLARAREDELALKDLRGELEQNRRALNTEAIRASS
jgi:hypothetical protein